MLPHMHVQRRKYKIFFKTRLLQILYLNALYHLALVSSEKDVSFSSF